MHATIEQFRDPVPDHSEIRAGQVRWATTDIPRRLQIVKRLRRSIANNAELLGTTLAALRNRPIEEKLVSEVLPLADACRFLERESSKILAPRKFGRKGRPLWLFGSEFEVHRQPLGVVLIIGPNNYPLFLPAVQALQALVAGNAVLIKPAPGTGAICALFVRLAREAGIDPSLLVFLPEDEGSVDNAIRAGVDKVVFTGSSQNGRTILEKLAETHTPSIMELSGEDPVIVLADADVDLVVRALIFGTQLNGGETCIAPRRLIVEEPVADELLVRCANAGITKIRVDRIRDTQNALQLANAGDYGLGASIFSRDISKAKKLAAELKTGFVTINDLIAPTADPRMPFGGIKASGFGTTRGASGLLEMTFSHVVSVRHSNSNRHLDLPTAGDAPLFIAYLQLVHGPVSSCWSAGRRLLKAISSRNRLDQKL
jgi:acyl-CoA reductase-like NAD-dependent aldehyde dehydrogenase